MDWTNSGELPPKRFVCAYCNDKVSSKEGWTTRRIHDADQSFVYICSGCYRPTFFEIDKQIPSPPPGRMVYHVPQNVLSLYAEARRSAGAAAYTSSVLASRKLLMNIAVSKGAKAGETFASYVEYLSTAGYVPPDGKHWVDHIRTKGNEATHEIELMTEADAVELIEFSEMLLKFIFEFPARMAKKP